MVQYAGHRISECIRQARPGPALLELTVWRVSHVVVEQRKGPLILFPLHLSIPTLTPRKAGIESEKADV